MVHVSSFTAYSTVNVTTLTATIKRPFLIKLVITLNEAIAYPVVAPFASTVNGVAAKPKHESATKATQGINRTTTGKSITWRNFRSSNMYPLFIIESAVYPIIINVSFTLTDPLLSIPGVILTPWNGTLAVNIRSLKNQFLSQLQNYTLNHNEFSVLTFEDTFNCASDRMILAMRQLIVDDANKRLKVEIETASLPPLPSPELGRQNTEKSNSNHMDSFEFSAIFNDPLYTVGLKVNLIDSPITTIPSLTFATSLQWE
jgi:hypothetical protein